MTVSSLDWQPLTPADIDAVCALAAIAHPDLPERPEVLAEKIDFFPAGCLKLVHNGRLAGYGLAHPWHLDAPPLIDTLLGALPADANCLHLHDAVVAPLLRGRSAGPAYIETMVAVARAHRIPTLALVSVYGTSKLWTRCGFRERATPAIARKLSDYGSSACYMVRPV
jgi:GNAT superfamily N-acetyltransferase